LPGKEAAEVTGAVTRSGQAGSNADGSAPRLECSNFSFTIPQFQGVNGDQLLYARLSRCVVVASDFHTADEISVSVDHVSPIIMFHGEADVGAVRTYVSQKSEKVQTLVQRGLEKAIFSGESELNVAGHANSSAPAAVNFT
jgi:hypothetical protein